VDVSDKVINQSPHFSQQEHHKTSFFPFYYPENSREKTIAWM